MLIMLLSLLAAPSAEAANMCTSLPFLKAKLTECEDNQLFSGAAEKCANSFRGRVKAEQAKLQAALKGQNKALITDKSGQTAQQAESEKVSAAAYKSAIESVSQLITKGEQARAEVAAYKKNLVWPIQWSVALGPAPREDQLESVFDEEYCYGEHSDIIKDALADFDKMIAELKAAKEAAAGFQGLSTSHQGNLNGGTAAPQTTGGKATGPAPTPAPTPAYDGSPKPGKSDISGTKEYEEQKKKGK